MSTGSGEAASSSTPSSESTVPSETRLSPEANARFRDEYYAQVAQDEFAHFDPQTLDRRAATHRQLAARRLPHTAMVSVVEDQLPDASGSGVSLASMVYVVTDDMPFLVDSVTAEIVRQYGAINLVVHPVFVVRRDQDGALEQVIPVPSQGGMASGDTAALPDLAAVLPQAGGSAALESWIAIELAPLGLERREQLATGLTNVLADVRAAVDDWRSMRQMALECAASLEQAPGRDQIAELGEAQELLRWMEAGNFTFLGYREYELISDQGQDALVTKQGSGLGVLHQSRAEAAATAKQVHRLTEAGRRKARERQALVITKANSRSTVHRSGYLDYVGVKSFDAQGNVTGERRFIGLFASTAYNSSVRDIPVVRQKVRAVQDHFGFPADSHSGKDLFAVLESYPRDEMFQIAVPDLIAIADGILRLQERRRTRLFLRPDIYGRFMSALVYIPRDRYTTAVRLRIEAELRETFQAETIDFEARMSDSALARLFFRIRLPRETQGHDRSPAELEALSQELEHRLVRAARSWAEGLSEALQNSYALEVALPLVRLWADAFPAGYRVDFEVEEAVLDVERFEAYEARLRLARRQHETLQDAAGLDQVHEDDAVDCRPEVAVYLPADVQDLEEDARLKLYLTKPRSLSQILPLLHNLGLLVLDERPFEITTADGRDFFLYDLGLKYPAGVDPLGTAELLRDAFGAAMQGESESDSFDRLVLQEQLSWRRVSVLRSYAKYLRQCGNTSSYDFFADALVANRAVATSLVELFEASFDPELADPAREARLAQVHHSLDAGLEQVPTLDADRALRALANAIEATLRTNYFQGKGYLSFKLDPRSLENLPLPRPHAEIWVYSPRVEGVHLRFGPIARGGLRWSDRREDFRTEILGLVKAQTVKNAVIVPTGAKGGFYAKRLPDPAVDRAAWMAEGIASYQVFIRGLLDLTDNLVNGQTAPPERVVRRDGDDSYLVVAADKGTASFSDIANSISADYGFWLGDAFASGGSVGYDHKAMGITARGAWESVKKHFSELDVDTQQESFTVAGVGDMSGDVFGNGMLLSEHLKLVAAFDHRHIFLDPNPDPAASFAERRRLFGLPRSSWADYDSSLLSEGGGIYPRSVKSIPVSEQVRKVLDLPEGTQAMSPPDLLRAILLAPVDLLYNGGIGTYVKASTERNNEVGDKANDAIRVDGRDLRVKVVGEGGNLGLTQRGRIEAALNGVILNTDAIDNSAGVDCSDHEVNIKIFIDRMVAAGRLESGERAAFLASLTEEVGALVLTDNVEQNILLLNDRTRVLEWGPSYERLMDWLEKNAGLDRSLEALPGTSELEDRMAAGQGLTSPELSVLAAYAKIELAKALSTSALVDDPWFRRALEGYFPRQLSERFAGDLESHPLRREIIATVVANDMINIGGITFAFRALEETSAGEDQIARAFVAIREIYRLDEVLAELSALPSSFPTAHWSTIHLDLRRLLDRAVRWMVNHGETTREVGELVDRYQPVVDALRGSLGGYLLGVDRERVEGWQAKAVLWGVPEPLATQWSQVYESFALLDVARIGTKVEEPAEDIAAVYYSVFAQFTVDSLLNRISALPRLDRWQALARAALRDDLYSTTADLTIAVMRSTEPGTPASARLEQWVALNREPLERARTMFLEVNQLEQDDMASLSVALRVLRSIVRS
ncbi:NAD-glutamate dehydrogenase [Psychromicrobium xiongbiense]|uniref:NAD-glutamate dehydrogenase n=1 Tax=Psychromicrobium xiongbiense TaxID=3051184 RepID=UPI0025567A56|nr:NAD-glutamate dehydrogenase [Psychromicrobium sp. YIM S02556]